MGVPEPSNLSISKEELNLVVVIRHKILQMEEIHEFIEPVEECEEVRIRVDDIGQWLFGSPA